MTEGTVLISDCAFWRREHGEPVRQRELLAYLAELGPVDLVYFGDSLGEYEQLTYRLMNGVSLPTVRCYLFRPMAQIGQNSDALHKLMLTSRPRRVVVTSTALSWVLQCVPDGVSTIIDGESANVAACLGIPEIVSEVKRFDIVLCARADVCSEANALLGKQCIRYAPTPITLKPDAGFVPPLPGGATRVGVYFGSGRVSYDAIQQIRDVIWHDESVRALHGSMQMVIGYEHLAADTLDAIQTMYPEFKLVCVAEDEADFFRTLSCVYIPNVGDMPHILVLEALGGLCPVVTMSEVVASVPDAVRNVCCVHDDFAGVVRDILRLVGDAEERAKDVGAIEHVARTTMSRQGCFGVIAGDDNHAAHSFASAELATDKQEYGIPSGLSSFVPAVPGGRLDASQIVAVGAEACPQPKVCICLRKFDCRPDDWQPVLRLPGIAVSLGAGMPQQALLCDLLITDDHDLAVEMVSAQGQEVWLCDLPSVTPQDPRIRLVPCSGGIRWSVGDLAAHLSVWGRNYSVRYALAGI